MTDCPNVEIQDRLPELLAGTLAAAEAAEVMAHVTSCAACRADLDLLRSVRTAAGGMPSVHVAAIVARLPRPAGAPGRREEGDARPRLTVIAGDAAPVRRGAAAGAPVRRPTWRRWQVAAALAVVAVGSLSVAIVRQGSLGLLEAGRTSLADSMPVGAVAVAPADSTVGTRPAPRPVETAAAQADLAVSYGDLGDYSTTELDQMLARLEQWDGAASTDPLPGVPLLPVSPTPPDGGDR